MAEYSVLTPSLLGPSDLFGPNVLFEQLPDGEIFALSSVPVTTLPVTAQSTLEFLQPGADSITDVTASAYAGATPTDFANVEDLGLIYLGSSSAPDIIIVNGGYDQYPHDGGQLEILGTDAEGQYVDESSALPLQIAFNYDVATGVIDGMPALADVTGGSEAGKPVGVQLLLANSDGSFTDWTSHLPASAINAGDDPGYGAAAIGDFADPDGDIFLGGSSAINGEAEVPEVLLVNDGDGNFTAVPTGIPHPTLNGYGVGATDALATQFYGDAHEDVIVDFFSQGLHTNTVGPNYYIQFLQGNGQGGFTDVTAQRFPNQPVLESAVGVDDWVQDIQLVEVNGRDDLMLYLAYGGVEVLINNGEDVFTPSPVQIPVGPGGFSSNLVQAAWGTDDGVGGFYGFTNADEWVFYPETSVWLTPTSATLNQPLASRVYLYGDGSGAATATTLAASFDTVITVSTTAGYVPGSTEMVSITVNGVALSAQALPSAYYGTFGGLELTESRELKWVLPGFVAVDSLQIDPTGSGGVQIQDVQVDGVDLGPESNSTPVNAQGARQYDLAPLNGAFDLAEGTAADPIEVTGTGSGVTAYVLGDPDDYTFGGIGTPTITLSESAGLDQNAVLTDVAFVDFQNGAVLNTETGSISGPLGPVVDIGSGQILQVNPGQSSSGVQDEGLVAVLSGGIVSDVVITDNGQMGVLGSAVGTVLSSGSASGQAALEIDPGGYSSGTLAVGDTGFLSAGAGYDRVEIIVEGLSLDDTLLSGAYELVSAGGEVSGAVVGNQASIQVHSGGLALATVVESGGQLYLSATASGSQIDSGGYESVFAGGTDTDGAVSSGGDLDINAGGSAVGFRVQGEIDVGGGIASWTVVTGDGDMRVDQGSAVGTVLSSPDGAAQLSVFGGTVVDTMVMAGADAYVAGGGVASATQVGPGGQLDLTGSSTDAVISAGGEETVYSGGVDSGADILAGGRLFVLSGGSAVGEEIQGELIISSGGVAQAITPLPGAEIEFVGLSATAASLEAGGLDLTSGGAVVGALPLAPGAGGLTFTVSSDGEGGTEVTFGSDIGADAFTNDGKSDILVQNTAGAVVVGELGAGGQEAYTQVAALGPEWKFVGTGDVLGAGADQFLIENTAGAVVVGEVAGGQAQYAQVASLGPEWRFVETGDFLGDGKTDFLIENAARAVVVGEVAGGQARYTQVAGLGPEWSFVGAGDVLGDGKTDFLIENTAGAIAVGEVVNGQAQYTVVAALGPEWKFVETGDFLGDNKTDFLIENTAGAVVVGEVTNGQAAYTTVGGLGPEWHFVGAGDYTGTGVDSFLIENTAGAIFTGTVVSGAAQYAQVGALGPEWTFHG